MKWQQYRKRISVCIPAYNAGKYIIECLESIMKQTYPSINIVVYDDGSTDDTAEKVEMFFARNRVRGKLIDYTTNKGWARAMNHAVMTCKTQYIFLMNADDVLKPDALEKMIICMQENDYDWVNCYGEKFGAGEGLLPVEENVSLDRIKQVNVLTSFAMMKKSVWDEAHGYDEDLTPEPYKAGYEDWDLWIRLIGLGKGYGVIHEPLYLYRIHDSQFGDIAHKESIIREILFNKHK